MDKTTVGLTEDVVVYNGNTQKKAKARIDTGAKSNSIDENLIKKLNIGKGDKTTIVKSSMGKAVRHVIMIEIELAGRKIKGRFTVADRSNLKYPILIGRNILKNGFLIDPGKK